MKTTIGIDVGISTTKIVGVRDGEVSSPLRIRATDPVTSLYGAFGKYLYDNQIDLNDIEQVMLTGVGAAYIDSPIYGLPTTKVEEFIADGLGAQHESQLSKMIVVSMGTGTSIVQCDGDHIKHIGGIGIGGGTLSGLSRLLLAPTMPTKWQNWPKGATLQRSTCSSVTSRPIRCQGCLWTPQPRSSLTHRPMPAVPTSHSALSTSCFRPLDRLLSSARYAAASKTS